MLNEIVKPRDPERSGAISGLILAWLLCLSLAPVRAQPLDLSVTSTDAVGRALSWLKEERPLGLNGALQRHRSGEFIPSPVPVLNFGPGSAPVWLALEVRNGSSGPLRRRLSLRSAWPDRVDVYFLEQGRLAAAYHTGDTVPLRERPVPDRYFKFDHDYAPGRTLVLMRFESPDPLVLALFLTTLEQDRHHAVTEARLYGMLYGGLLLLAGYNILLFLSLRSLRYLYYAAYLACFVVLNLSYTGLIYQWFWPVTPALKQWSGPLLILLYSMIGLAFALRFLNTEVHLPRARRMVGWPCLLVAAAMALAVATGSRLMALYLALFFIPFFTLGMILLGVFALRAGERSARFFLLASVTHSVTATFTALTVVGLVPYTLAGFHAVEFGMVIDAMLLALALADQFRLIQEERFRAVQLAMVDPLTGLNNRRAFQRLVRPVWNNGLRKGHAMSVVMLDLDHFKQINDRYGHGCGDRVLRKLAQLLGREARSSDVVARWGGEEFILFLGETTLKEAKALAERIRRKLATVHLQEEGETLTFTASFGVASLDGSCTDLNELIATADKGVYAAKRSGRNRVCGVQEPGAALAAGT